VVYKKGLCPKSEDRVARLVCINVGPDTTKTQADSIIAVIKESLEEA
jgi:dTDP-4-amino-4,6-dideoxygalactose transaminase